MKPVPDPVLDVPLPRPIRPRKGWLSFDPANSCIFVLTFPVWCFFMVRGLGEAMALVAGRTVAAPIVAARHSEGKGGGDFISYRYGATSEDVGEVRIPLDTQESLSVGKMLPVKMLGTGHFVRVSHFLMVNLGALCMEIGSSPLPMV